MVMYPYDEAAFQANVHDLTAQCMKNNWNVELPVIESLVRWVMYACEPGHFLTGMLCKDMDMAFGHADTNNQRHLWDVYCLLYNCTPRLCWGSREQVKEWAENGGIGNVQIPY